MTGNPSAPVIGIRIRQWHKWQAAIIRTVAKRRIEKNVPLEEPYSMGKVVIATDLDHHFLTFQAICQHPFADAFWSRTLRYCASKGALSGEVLVQKAHFGRCVLSTTWSEIENDTGVLVYDALVQSQLVTEIGPKQIGKGLTHARSTYGPAQSPRRSRAGSKQKPRKPRARDSGSGSGSGSGSAGNPQPPSKGEGLASLPDPEPERRPKRKSAAAAKFDTLDPATKRKAVIEWASKEASKSRDPGQWRAPASSIRADVRENRPYPDSRVERDFGIIRAKDARGLAAIVRRLLRESRDRERNGCAT